MMQPTGLTPHPEGGRYREVFRSDLTVTLDGRPRAAMTHIYFELSAGERSRLHRVIGDEIWNLYQGDGVRLLLWDGESEHVERVELSVASNTFCHVVPSGWWQAAEPIGERVLVGCSVAPGFEFDDFAMLTTGSDAADRLLAIDGSLSEWVAP